jgi:hypothetical protein
VRDGIGVQGLSDRDEIACFRDEILLVFKTTVIEMKLLGLGAGLVIKATLINMKLLALDA